MYASFLRPSLFLLMFWVCALGAADMQPLGPMAIDRTEVTTSRFRASDRATATSTQAVPHARTSCDQGHLRMGSTVVYIGFRCVRDQ